MFRPGRSYEKHAQIMLREMSKSYANECLGQAPGQLCPKYANTMKIMCAPQYVHAVFIRC